MRFCMLATGGSDALLTARRRSDCPRVAKGPSVIQSQRSAIRLTRRTAIKASMLFGAAGAAPVLLRSTSARQTPIAQNTEVSGKLVEWGFGIAETNPMARARVLAFQEAFPNVELEIVESFDEQKLLTAVASDTVPDVLWLSRFETATWASRDVLQPLTDYIERDGYDTSDLLRIGARRIDLGRTSSMAFPAVWTCARSSSISTTCGGRDRRRHDRHLELGPAQRIWRPTGPSRMAMPTPGGDSTTSSRRATSGCGATATVAGS